MIFVTVGNATQGFSRLLKAVEHLGKSGHFGDERLLIQTGSNPLIDLKWAEQVDFLPLNAFLDAQCAARVIISHGGAGTLLQILQLGRVPVVMPREKKFGEHVDNHQVELVQALALEKRVIPVWQKENLLQAISQVDNVIRQSPSPNGGPDLHIFSRAIEELIGKP